MNNSRENFDPYSKLCPCMQLLWSSTFFYFIFLEAIAPRQTKGNTSKSSESVGSGRATLRLRSKGPAVVEEVWFIIVLC